MVSNYTRSTKGFTINMNDKNENYDVLGEQTSDSKKII